MKKILVVILILFTAAITEAQLRWRVVGKMPYPVSGGQVIYDIAAQSNKIYILGGYSDSLQSAVDWIQEYDVEKNSWQMVGRMIQPRDQFVADLWKNSIMYFGGTVDASTDKNTLESWDYKIVSNLASVYDRNKNFGRLFSTGQIVGENFYIIGGDPATAGDTLSYIQAYNLSTKQNGISFNSPSPDPPRQRMTFIVGNNIYIFGGVINGVMKAIQKFNISTQTLADMPEQLNESRAAGSAVYNPLSKKGFLIGGYNETLTALNTVEQVEIQPDGSLKITQSLPMTYARAGLMAVAYKNGFVAVFGGRTDRGHLGKVVPYIEILDEASSVQDGNNLPNEFALDQNFPNPFNPSTVISYQVSTVGQVQLKIYDFLGREIAALVNEEKSPGKYQVGWNGEDKNGNKVPSGIYFYRMTAGNYSLTKKMLLLK
ncbi:MAG: T9SS type A sorting domain-containing protein [Ignavibacteriales bacterium]|nr:T9SS type A sorting domain-containing protein [Ignavibacteriales bacterium]